MSLYSTSDFDELVLAHLLRCPTIYNRAKKLRIQADDFLSSLEAGIQLYKDVATIALELNMSPIPRNILELELNAKFESGGIFTVEPELVTALLNWFYSTDLSEGYVNEHLIEFIRYRRFSKAQQQTKDSVDLFTQMTALDRSIPKTDRSVIAAPMLTPILCTPNTGISTGFDSVDRLLGGGTHREECGLIMAASGSGKTSMGVNFTIGGMRGHNTLYVSLEEPMEHLTQRFYANLFDLPYTLLKNGVPAVQAELIEKFESMTDLERAMYSRLKVVDARGLCPITYKGIEELIEKTAQEDGFVTDQLIIDQLDFMAPYKTVAKGADKWREYEQITFEIDELSNYKIGDTTSLGVWVLHQIRGKPRWEYTFDDIAGYKGVVKPFDLALGVGRMPGTEYINLHSLKTRHGEPFAKSFLADFAKMRFIESNYKPKRDRKGEVIMEGGDTTKKPKREEAREENDDVYTGTTIAPETITPP